MKRLFLVIAIAVSMFTVVSSAGAWQVNVTNSCNKNVTIFVYGSHLFWKSLDCSVSVNSGATGVCQMPGGICPTDINGSYFSVTSVYDLNQVHCMNDESLPCCWNVNVEVVQMGPDSCQLKIR
jgi:hypothetical protein